MVAILARTTMKGPDKGEITPVGTCFQMHMAFTTCMAMSMSGAATGMGGCSGNATDTTGPASGFFRVLRGGSWFGNARHSRSANRLCSRPGNRIYDFGFRLCCSAGPRE